jgi:ribosomal protein L2
LLENKIVYDRVSAVIRGSIEGLAIGFKGRPSRKLARIINKKSSFSGHHHATHIRVLSKANLSKRLSSAYSRSRGRSNSGTVTVYSKGSARKSSFVNYTSTLKSFKRLLMVVGISRDPQSYRLAALCATADGSILYTPATNRSKLFKAVFGAEISFKAMIFGSSMKLYKYRYCEYVSILKFYNSICFIAKSGDAPITLSKSAGSSSMTLVRKARDGFSGVPVRLPSGSIKLICSDVIVMLGHILPRKAQYFKNTRAGY